MDDSGGAGRVVLLVDDEPDILQSLKQLIEMSLPGVKVETSRSGAEALEVLRREKVHLILTDYKMPGMSGLEFLVKADHVARGIPRAIVTAFPREAIASPAMKRVGVADVFTKPIDVDKVVGFAKAKLGL
ncbi:MAG: response regulator [Methanobacteriota archaeon]